MKDPLTECAKTFRVSREMICGGKRGSQAKHPVRARYAAFWVYRNLWTDMPNSFAEIGVMMGGYNHATVMHGIRRAEEMRAADPTYCRITDRILEECRA